MKISTVTRRNITDAIRISGFCWAGRLEETEFLNRLYDLSSLPSDDGRFSDASGDIWQHRVNNSDWESDWVFNDDRFQILDGPDVVFLRFLCEMLHPLVRPDSNEVVALVQLFNRNLTNDGWEIVKETEISGQPVFAARPRLTGSDHHMMNAENIAEKIDASYVTQQITRLRAAVDDDAELAIGTAKEFVESVCKSILKERNVVLQKADDFPRLVKTTLKALKLVPDDIPDSAKAAKTIKTLLSNLATVSKGLAELRNPYGTGHGKDPSHRGLESRHARLAVGAAVTLATFLFDSHQER